MRSYRPPSVLVVLLLAAAPLAPAQTGSPNAGRLDGATRDRIIDKALALLDEHYVFPDVATRMADAVRQSQRRREYDGISDTDVFRARFEEDLQRVSRDKHLSVIYSAAPTPGPRKEDASAELDRARLGEMLARQNHCFERVERLAGNIGYIDLRCFGPPDLIAETAAAAFTFVGHTSAVIVDLRENMGGDPAGVALVCSYVFETPTHVNDVYYRRENRTQEFWTAASVAGRRLGGRAVYVLTSSRTFSAGEEFAYDLQQLKRATVVGEVTGGGAHPVRPYRIDEHFAIGVPFARSINPITRANWEGTGVSPDEAVPAREALTTAHLQALRTLHANAVDAPTRRELDEAMAMVRADVDRRSSRP